MITPDQLPTLLGAPVIDRDGVPLGTFSTYYSHPVTGEPVWAGICRPGAAGPVQFAPLAGSTNREGAVQLAVAVAAVAAVPFVDPAVTFNDDHAALLSTYYGLPALTGTLPAELRAADESASADSVVRSEEHLRVSTRTVPTERVRLRKLIVTEEKTITVTVRREEFQLTREPLDTDTVDDAPGAADTHPRAAGGIDLLLHEEQIVVTTKVVPVERVHIDIEQVSGHVDVTGDIRKERFDIDTRTSPTDPDHEKEHTHGN